MPKQAGPRIRTRTGRASRQVRAEDGEARKEAPPCDNLGLIFYGDELDLRDEIGREEREAVAKAICIDSCPFRFSCLEYALLNNEKHGVWGGMSPGDRREFKADLRRQGYKKLPTGSELRLNVNLWEGTDGGDGSGPVDDGDRARCVQERYAHPDDQSSDRDPSDDPVPQAS